jgi:CBS domain-containing protein
VNEIRAKMTVGNLKDAVRPIPPLQPGDSAAKAVRLMRAKGVPVLSVARGPAIIGTVSERDVLELLAAEPNIRCPLGAVPVEQLMHPTVLAAAVHQRLEDVVGAIRADRAEAVPVVDSGNRYLGMLLTRDILAALAGEPIVPPVAGLATPGCVYLTTGALRAGASDLGLLSTGAALMLLDLIAAGVVTGVSWLAGRLLLFPEGLVGTAGVIADVILGGLHVLVFFALLRVSPLTGMHGAEHMVVHAIEEGEDLNLQKVRQMPRVHPRCGTNLLALLILLVVAQQFLASLGGVDEATGVIALFLLVMIVLLTWRRLGTGLQRWVTTKRPSDLQLTRTIEVAEELLEKIRAQPSARASAMLRLWHSGFPQVLLGFFALALAADYAPVAFAELWRALAN